MKKIFVLVSLILLNFVCPGMATIRLDYSDSYLYSEIPTDIKITGLNDSTTYLIYFSGTDNTVDNITFTTSSTVYTIRIEIPKDTDGTFDITIYDSTGLISLQSFTLLVENVELTDEAQNMFANIEPILPFILMVFIAGIVMSFFFKRWG